MDLAALDERGVAEDGARRLVEGLRAIEDHEQTAVGAQAPALQIRQQALTHGRVLGGALPEAKCVLLTIGCDAEGDDEAMLADVDAVEQQRDEVEVVQRRGLPRPQLRRRLGQEPPTDTALAGAAAHDVARDGLQTARILAGRDAHQHLLHDAAIQRIGLGQRLEGGQRDFAALGADPRPRDGHLPAAEYHFARDGPRARRAALGLMRITRPTERGAVFLQQRAEDLEARPHHQLEEFGLRINQEFHKGERADGGRFNNDGRTGCARLLHGGSFTGRLSPRFGHHSCSTSSEEPPLQFSTVSGTSPKTDRRDALKLARCYRAGDLTPLWVPDAAHEALRDLVRAREAAKKDQLRARHRLGKFLLRQGRRPLTTIKAWTHSYLAWVKSAVHFDQLAQEVTLLDYLHEVEHAAERIAQLERAIDAAVQTAPGRQRAVIEALQALRGIALISAATIVAEVGELSRFAKPRQLMGYSGTVASEDSSGDRIRRGGITKTGNAHLRRIVGEAAWAYRHRPTIGPALRKRQALLDAGVNAIAWKAQHRLHSRYRALTARGKTPQHAAMAVGRELLGFIWAIGVHVEATDGHRNLMAVQPRRLRNAGMRECVRVVVEGLTVWRTLEDSMRRALRLDPRR